MGGRAQGYWFNWYDLKTEKSKNVNTIYGNKEPLQVWVSVGMSAHAPQGSQVQFLVKSTYLGCRYVPRMWEATNQRLFSLSVFLSRMFFFSLSLPPSFPLSKKKKNQWKKYSPVRINKNKRTIYGKRKKYCRELFKDHIKLSASLISSV